MRVVVPFAAETPKTRLSAVLEPEERRAFARVMLEDILATLRAAGADPEVLATTGIDIEAPVTVDDRPLTEAVNAVLAEAEEAVAVVMADLALLTADAVDRLLDAGGEVVIAPGRGGGTNALVARHPDFRVDYHGVSYLDHVGVAEEVGAAIEVVDSHRLATDVDEPADLPELLIHGEGAAHDWLKSAGFELVVDGGRVTTERDGS
ncbi:MAG: 2-phospho-L-lactate guanylyltransferase [Halobacteriales archaeon]